MLFADMVPYWDAFWVLNRSRPTGMGLGAVPLSEIAAYVGLFGCRRPQYLFQVVDALDRDYLAHQAENEKRRQKAQR